MKWMWRKTLLDRTLSLGQLQANLHGTVLQTAKCECVANNGIKKEFITIRSNTFGTHIRDPFWFWDTDWQSDTAAGTYEMNAGCDQCAYSETEFEVVIVDGATTVSVGVSKGPISIGTREMSISGDVIASGTILIRLVICTDGTTKSKVEKPKSSTNWYHTRTHWNYDWRYLDRNFARINFN